MRGLMRRLWPASLVGQLVGLLLLALALSQGIGFLIYHDERTRALRGVVTDEFVSRAASVVQLLEATPSNLHDKILRAVATTYSRYWLTPTEPGDVAAWQRQAWQHLGEALPASTAHVHAPSLMHAANDISSFLSFDPAAAATRAAWGDLPAGAWPLGRRAKLLRLDAANGLGLAVALDSGDWLNIAYAKPPPPDWPIQSYISLAVGAVAISLVAFLTARRIARPLRQLALAAEGFGRGEDGVPLQEAGPRDIQQTAAAFNRMRSRLRRLIEDRTRMLAALGHDLRTPITALRLRAEFVGDAGVRDRLIDTLDEMQAMTEGALAFVREEEAAGKATRSIDLAALLDSLCDDLADLGCDVTLAACGRTPYRCRPEALRRAVRNLIQNAVRYGGRARVALRHLGEGVEITVDDDGPGIPEAELEHVFVPFVRLERSRNRETGGVGLGLSIARTVARDHGGDILLANRPEGGLRATIRLPPLCRAQTAVAPVGESGRPGVDSGHDQRDHRTAEI